MDPILLNEFTDTSGEMYIADTRNLRKITTNGTATTIECRFVVCHA